MSFFSIVFPAEYKTIEQLKMKLNVNEVKGAQTEVNTLKDKVKALEEAAANPGDAELPQALVDAINGVAAQVQVVDDAIPDVSEVPVDETPTPQPPSQ